ncbi:MAG: AraC family transcriptional regulator [Oscillospiraceae bacterium]|nr:AraC family transcriptional regulator [Oscillospiraceae bacterium]
MNYQPLVPRRLLQVREIYTVHYFEYTAGCIFPGERHNFWELLYVDKGEIRVQAGEQTSRLRRGQLIFHAPGEFHAFADLGTPPDLVVVSFRCDAPEMEAFRGLTMETGEEERVLLARIVAESAAAFSTPLNDPYAAVLERREHAPFGGEQLLCAALEELLIRLIRRQTAPIRREAPLRDGGNAFAQVTAYLETRLDRQLTLEEICQDNLVGRSQLQKLFHARTGGGVMEYFAGRKIQAAQRLIREGRLNFTQIAARLGFQSLHYFSRRFRQATGMSPSEYARSVKMLSELSGIYPDDHANNG